jgi:hypothetical protein
MTDETFILLLKAEMKDYYINNRSVGLEVQKLVRQFRQSAIEDSSLRKPRKRKIINENKSKNRP